MTTSSSMAKPAIVLSQDNVHPGTVLWLDAGAKRRNWEDFAKSTLTEGSLDHPVLVIKVIGDYTWLCILTTGRGDIPIAHFNHDRSRGTYCRACGIPHKYDFQRNNYQNEMLYAIDNDTQLEKTSHVTTRIVYEAPISLLRLERSQSCPEDFKIDDRSLNIVLEKAALAMQFLRPKSRALKQFPESPPLDFSKLPKPVNSKLDFGYYSGFDQGVTEPSRSVQTPKPEQLAGKITIEKSILIYPTVKSNQLAIVAPPSKCKVGIAISQGAREKAAAAAISNDHSARNEFKQEKPVQSMKVANLRMIPPQILASTLPKAPVQKPQLSTEASLKPVKAVEEEMKEVARGLEEDDAHDADVASLASLLSEYFEEPPTCSSHHSKPSRLVFGDDHESSLVVYEMAADEGKTDAKDTAPTYSKMAKQKIIHTAPSTIRTFFRKALSLFKTTKSTTEPDVVQACQTSEPALENGGIPTASAGLILHADDPDLKPAQVPNVVSQEVIVPPAQPRTLSQATGAMAPGTVASPRPLVLTPTLEVVRETFRKAPDFRAGDVVYCMPGIHESNSDPYRHLSDIRNRPCVVLASSVTGVPDQIPICSITSFGGRSIETVRYLDPASKRNYLAIATRRKPSPHPGHPTILLVNHRSMPLADRVSYVNANKSVLCPKPWLQQLRESRYLGHHRLDAASLEILITTVARNSSP